MLWSSFKHGESNVKDALALYSSLAVSTNNKVLSTEINSDSAASNIEQIC